MSFKPFVSPAERPREFSLRATLLGMFLSLVFAVGNTYLGLKLGITISASIPAAVMSMAILKLFSRKVTILENNIVQTVATVGEGLAAGVIFTIPALFLLDASPSVWHIFLLSMLGGILGVLFMIPMRRYIIVQEHGILPFPEGTACAEILKVGEKNQPYALLAGWGLLVGSLYKIANSALYLWNESVSFTIKKYQQTMLSLDATPALLGVGYIVGPRISAVVFAGGALAWWIFIPLIKQFGGGSTPIYPSSFPIAEMSAVQIWSSYVRYIGAGAVAVGGLITLFKIAPVIRKTMSESLKELRHLFKPSTKKVERTDKDIPLSYLILGSIAIILALWLFPGFHLNFLTIILLVILGFFFVAVTSVTVGLVGSSSNPVSGMTMTTLLITSLIFLGIGWTDRVYLVSAIVMGAVANIAICLAATTSQDLKTGFLLGATPRSQQLAEILGLILPALGIGVTLYLLNQVYRFGSSALPAPQATLMFLIAKGVIQGQLPVILVVVGVVLGLIALLLRLPVLPFAIGLYLPLSLSAAMMVGGVVNYLVHRITKSEESVERGILVSSGLVAGDTCTGVVIALLTLLGIVPAEKAAWLPSEYSLIFYCVLGAFLGWLSYRGCKGKGGYRSPHAQQ